jgi:hypothetical protein
LTFISDQACSFSDNTRRSRFLYSRFCQATIDLSAFP